jgi:pimeloyl-ACP methyl ester carboxylesterase
VYAQRLHYFASEDHETWNLLPSITAPTLVIHGDQDRINATANASLLAKRIPRAQLHLVRGARHAFYLEFRKEASRVVKEFLAKHSLSG